MKLVCIGMEFDLTKKKFVFAFAKAEEQGEEGCTLSGSLRLCSDRRDEYMVGESYELTVK